MEATFQKEDITFSKSGVRFNATHYARVLEARFELGLEIPNSVRKLKEHIERKKKNND